MTGRTNAIVHNKGQWERYTIQPIYEESVGTQRYSTSPARYRVTSRTILADGSGWSVVSEYVPSAPSGAIVAPNSSSTVSSGNLFKVYSWSSSMMQAYKITIVRNGSERGTLIDTITAEKGTYPDDGIATYTDGNEYWFVKL